MEVVRTITHHVELSPDKFSGDVVETAKQFFSREIVGKCLKKHGEVLRVLRTIACKQEALSPTGSARFLVTCEALLFQVQVDAVMVATVVRVDPIGAVMKNKCVDIYVPAQHNNVALLNEHQSALVRIVALRHENDRFCAVAELVT